MPEIVSTDTNSKIDFRILIGIFAGVVLFQIYLGFLDLESDVENSIITLSLIGQSLTGIASLIVARKHSGSKLAISFYSLAMAFFSLVIGEVIYNTYLFVLDIDPYPSVSDLFFFLLYPFSMVHLIINIRFYQIKITLKSIIGMIAISVIITSTYTYFAFDVFSEFNIDFYYGLIFVAGAAVITTLGVYAVIIVRNIPLVKSWILLVVGILLGTVADVWYHYLELLDAYNTEHVVNLFWYASYFVIIYSLYKHYKIM